MLIASRSSPLREASRNCAAGLHSESVFEVGSYTARPRMLVNVGLPELWFATTRAMPAVAIPPVATESSLSFGVDKHACVYCKKRQSLTLQFACNAQTTAE